MPKKLIAPRPGEGVEELVVSTWLKNEGDHVEEMESIVEVETDKVVTEIPSPASGTVLKILVPQGQTVKVGAVMALIGEAGESEDNDQQITDTGRNKAVSAKAADEKPAESQIADPQISVNLGTAADAKPPRQLSPLVRRMIAENKLDPAKIKGTGNGGRITKFDIEAYLASPQQTFEATESTTSSIRLGTQTSQAVITEGDQLVPHTNLRRQIAERMVNSLAVSPHVLTVMEADLTNVLAHRTAHKAAFAAQGITLTLTAYFIAAMVEALKMNPQVNASWTDEGLLLHRDINIGMAVALGEAGLIVPVIKQAQNLSLQGIAHAVNDLSARARSKKLNPEEVRDGTFTLTNHGSGGSLFASPIINQPQLGILGTGKMQKRAVVIATDQGDSIAIRPMIYLSFVFDHRALDGESADKFLTDVKTLLERWS